MKKLMIAAAIVCAAAFVHAANINWNVTGIDPDSGSADSCYCYAFISDAGGTATTAYSLETIVNAIKAGNDPYDFLPGAYGDGATDWANAAGIVTLSSTKGIDVTGASSDTPKTIHAMMVIIDADDVASANNYQVVDLGDVVYQSTSATPTIAAVAGNDWQPIKEEPVPEPFSGVLALVGMGAIALRRKMKKAKA